MNVLLINDICSHGIVGSNAIKVLLEAKGFNVFNIPSLILSNTFNFDNVYKIDTSDYLEACLNEYEKENLVFEYILIGYLANQRQAMAIEKFIKKQNKAFIVVDPTMADNGKLYSGVNTEVVNYMDELAKLSDLLIPNYTEAKLLCHQNMDNIDQVIDKMKSKYNNFLITSYQDQYNYLYQKAKDKLTIVKYNKIGDGYPGTGDLFVGFLMANYQELGLEKACEKASESLSDLISKYGSEVSKYNGLAISAYLNNF